MATSIYFLLHPNEFSKWHRVYSDELWLWHAGSPLQLVLGGDGENPGERKEIVLGMDLEKGQVPQALVMRPTYGRKRARSGTSRFSSPASYRPAFISTILR